MLLANVMNRIQAWGCTPAPGLRDR